MVCEHGLVIGYSLIEFGGIWRQLCREFRDKVVSGT